MAPLRSFNLTRMRAVLAPLVAILALAAGVSAASPAPSLSVSPGAPPSATAGPPGVWRRPVNGPVVRPFQAPVSAYGRGHRGVDLAAVPNAPVRAASDGRVRFAGRVAERSLVVIEHPGGITTEYEPIAPLVRSGQLVPGGSVVGRVLGLHPGCRGPCLHWGASSTAGYFDPMLLLYPLAPVRLLPWDQARG